MNAGTNARNVDVPSGADGIFRSDDVESCVDFCVGLEIRPDLNSLMMSVWFLKLSGRWLVGIEEMADVSCRIEVQHTFIKFLYS